MTIDQIVSQIKIKKSFLCVGLDVDLDKIPEHLLKSEDPIFDFSKSIIDSTAPFAIAYKPNIAFFESYGLKGWKSLGKVIEYLNLNYPEVFTIADAKRGDIGNTSLKYAKTFFEIYNFDAITVSPYMGEDSIKPFLDYKEKQTILLALTSNDGANDFQYLINNHIPLFKLVISKSKKWTKNNNLMYVVGATKAESLKEIRILVPDAFLLIPGLGAQGGNLEKVSEQGMNDNCGLIVNSSRSIIYADSSIDFAEASAKEAEIIQRAMSKKLKEKGVI
jgi:orotidine-5'-phosphate decarboxylase